MQLRGFPCEERSSLLSAALAPRLPRASVACCVGPRLPCAALACCTGTPPPACCCGLLPRAPASRAPPWPVALVKRLPRSAPTPFFRYLALLSTVLACAPPRLTRLVPDGGATADPQLPPWARYVGGGGGDLLAPAISKVPRGQRLLWQYVLPGLPPGGNKL